MSSFDTGAEVWYNEESFEREGEPLKRFVCAVLAALLMSVLVMTVSAEETEARNIFGNSILKAHTGFRDVDELIDGNTVAPMALGDNTSMTLQHPEGIGSMYMIFNKEYGPFSVTDLDSGEVRTFGENCFIHEFADLETAFGYAPTKVKLDFLNGPGQMNEFYVFTPGKVPDFVQKWEKPKDGETDIVLFSTHGDDEQLFFAGLLPYYAKERGYQVQVVYLTNHRNVTYRRAHEMLNGLWAVGVTTYPVFGSYYDLMSGSQEEALRFFRAQGVTEEELLGFVVENLRRFRPMVAVGHDLQGEYGHGQHMVYADLLTKAIEITSDPEQYPESAEKYGTWDVPKTYLHLYPENEIYLDWDQPLDSFGGMTAFEVTQKRGYPCHKSQYWDFAWYLAYKTTAEEITEFSPCEYGLYRSTVGPDVLKNDMFENVKTHVQRKAEEEAARLAAEEEAKRQEEERLAAEAEAKRQKEERLKKEAEERAAEEERLKLQQEAARQEQLRRKQLMTWGIAGTVTLLLLLGVIVAVLDRKNKI